MWEGVKLSWVITTSEKELVEQKIVVVVDVGPRLVLVCDGCGDGMAHCEAVQCVGCVYVGCFLWFVPLTFLPSAAPHPP